MYKRYIALAVVLLACMAGYTVFWFAAASNLEDKLAEWRDAAQREGYAVSFDEPHIQGYPFRLVAGITALRIVPLNEGASGSAYFDKVSIVFQAWSTDHAVLVFEGDSTLASGGSGQEFHLTGARMSLSGVSAFSGGGGDGDREWRLSAMVDTVSFGTGVGDSLLIQNLEQHLVGAGQDLSFSTRMGRAGPFAQTMPYGLGETLDGAQFRGRVRLDALDQGFLTLVVKQAELTYGPLQIDGEIEGMLDLNSLATNLNADVTISNADHLFTTLEANDRALAASVMVPLRTLGDPDGLGGLRLSGSLLARDWTFANGSTIAHGDLVNQLGLGGFRLLPRD